MNVMTDDEIEAMYMEHIKDVANVCPKQGEPPPPDHIIIEDKSGHPVECRNYDRLTESITRFINCCTILPLIFETNHPRCAKIVLGVDPINPLITTILIEYVEYIRINLPDGVHSVHEMLGEECMFIYAGGDFYLRGNDVRSLKGCPLVVNGDFCCSDLNLVDLKNAPCIVRSDFRCIGNSELTCIHNWPTDNDGRNTVICRGFIQNHFNTLSQSVELVDDLAILGENSQVDRTMCEFCEERDITKQCPHSDENPYCDGKPET